MDQDLSYSHTHTHRNIYAKQKKKQFDTGDRTNLMNEILVQKLNSIQINKHVKCNYYFPKLVFSKGLKMHK